MHCFSDTAQGGSFYETNRSDYPDHPAGRTGRYSAGNQRADQDHCPREYFIDGSAAAVVCGNWDYSYIAETLNQNDPEKLANMKIAVLPEGREATSYEKMQNGGFGYGLAINSKVAEDPDKLAACIDLIEYLSGPAFAEYVGSRYGLGGFYTADFDTTSLNSWDVDLYNFTYLDTRTVQIYDSYLSGDIWGVLNAGMQEMTDSAKAKDPAELAAETQAAYETYLAAN